MQAQSQGHYTIDRLKERRRKRKRSTILLERTRKRHRQSDKHWNCFKGKAGETSENSNTLFYKDFSLDSVKTCLTSSTCLSY